MMKTRYHLEPFSLDEALSKEADRVRAGWNYDWHYVAVGQYFRQVVRYLEYFGADSQGEVSVNISIV